MAPRDPLYLIDGSSYIYRAFYALTRLTNARGMATQAVYGFAQMLVKVLREKAPRLVCVVFDPPGPTFRHGVYPAYKATRQKMPEDLAAQVPYIKELVRCHGVPQLEAEGFEADDVIATLVGRAEGEGLPVVVVSGDKDLLQLVRDPAVMQWDPQRDRIFDEKAVAERYGVPPSRILDYLALTGDSSDNIPGVPGVGEKTAVKLLEEFGSFEAVLARAGEIGSAALRKKIEAGRESALLSRGLVSLRTDVPLPVGPSGLAPVKPDAAGLLALYEELGFKSLAEPLRAEASREGSSGARPGAPPARAWAVASSREALDALLVEMAGKALLSLRFEAAEKDAMLAVVTGVSLSWEAGKACFVPVAPGEGGEGLPLSEVIAALRPLLSGDVPLKAGHDLKRDWVILKRHGVELAGIAFDTLVAAYLLDPGSRAHELSRIAEEQLGEGAPALADGAEKGEEGAREGACAAVETVIRLVPVLSGKLREAGLDHLFRTLEVPLIEVLARMEHRGILVDTARLEGLSRDFEKLLDQKADRIFDLAGERFNIGSPKQLQQILFEKLKLTAGKKTKTGLSTDVQVLEVLAAEHPIAGEVLAHRLLSKLKGTYIDALPRLVHPETGRVHTSYNQAVAATGRLSSSDPNLQNIPIRTEEGRHIRAAFIPAPGCLLLSADYSQIELRILAHYSKDERLIEAFRTGEDIHRRTAAEMLGIPPHGVTPEMRRQAKMINFGIIYGMSPFGLAQRLGIGGAAAKAAIERYYATYKGVFRLVSELIEEAAKTGETRTLLGRRRSIPEVQSRNRAIRQQGERLAVNTPIQGTAADLLKKAMIDVEAALRERRMRTAMLLTVHDELVFEAPEEELEAARLLVTEKMENVWRLDVPLTVEVGWGRDWASAHP